MLRQTVLTLAAVSQLTLAATALAANNGNLTRREIRAMPILERPSRPGHFYGNTVRRNYYRGASSQVQMGTPSPAWQGYVAPSRPNPWIEPSHSTAYFIGE